MNGYLTLLASLAMALQILLDTLDLLPIESELAHYKALNPTIKLLVHRSEKTKHGCCPKTMSTLTKLSMNCRENKRFRGEKENKMQRRTRTQSESSEAHSPNPHPLAPV